MSQCCIRDCEQNAGAIYTFGVNWVDRLPEVHGQEAVWRPNGPAAPLCGSHYMEIDTMNEAIHHKPYMSDERAEKVESQARQLLERIEPDDLVDCDPWGLNE
jgi:hypothetical protein